MLPDSVNEGLAGVLQKSQCTYRCVVLPDNDKKEEDVAHKSQCTYRCVVLPDTHKVGQIALIFKLSQCTYSKNSTR